MAKVIRFIGNTLIAVSILFLLTGSLIVVSDGHVRKDIFGLTIPTPANWTSFIPYLGFVLGIIVELFSLHGLVVIIATLLLFTVGVKLSNYSGSKKSNSITTASIIPDALRYSLMEVLRAYKSGNVSLTNTLTAALGSDKLHTLLDRLLVENHPRPSSGGRAFDKSLYTSLTASLIEKGYDHDAAQIIIGIINNGLEPELMAMSTGEQRSAT